MTRKKEPFEPLEPGKVRMYNCGPTVYDHFHMGNARNFVAADVIRRYLEFRGYDVVFAQNITDIDDKIIQRAGELGVDAAELAEKFTKVFFLASEKLAVRPADHHPRATQYVGKMIAMMKKLEQKGYAYAAGGDLYFRVEASKGYGKLSGRNIEDLRAGARVEIAQHKENPVDFTLWKAAKPGEPSWKSPWGDGRPGWHTECAVMAADILGETFDIHMGGSDLIFPHHENEIAQSEAVTGKPLARYWIHNGFLNIDGEKMSKSLGNFFTIDQVLDKFEAPVVRFFLLNAHYRAPMDFSDTALQESAVALARLRDARAAAHRLLAGRAEAPDELPEAAQEVENAFRAAMDDDFNTPRALAALFEAAAKINQLSNKADTSEGKLNDEDRAVVAALAHRIDALGGGILGIELAPPQDELDDIAEQLISLLIEVRAEARKEKLYNLSDKIRDGLARLDIELLDRPAGTEWKRQ